MLSDGSKTCSCGGGCHSFGACLRAKNIRTAVGEPRRVNREWDDHLDRYEYAVSQGIQPASTTVEATSTAVAISEATGEPYRADV